MLFDFTTQEWGELAQTHVSYRTWSRDSKYVYFTDQFGREPQISASVLPIERSNGWPT